MPDATGFLLALPWLLPPVLAALLAARRVRIAAYAPPPADHAPLVSIVVPARNESANIGACVASLLNSLYPRTQIIVVDDDSTDGTGDIVRILAEHADDRIELVTGAPLPAGWLGKPWACWQGYQHARGDLILFTDADTRHDDALLGHAVGALQSRGADLVTVMPRQLMGSFWERLILPQIFTLISMRFRDLERISRTRNPRDVIANGQFLLVQRAAYEAVGGHAALRGDVVDDQRLAQRLVASGRRLFVAAADDLIETRMYRSLAGIVEGWTKNLAHGSRQAAPRWIAPFVPWLIALFLLCAWVVPPLALVWSIFTRFGGTLYGWSVTATAASLAFWISMHARTRVPLHYAAGYPLGAAVAAALFVRSALRGAHVVWKGRRYEVDAATPPAD